MANKDKQLNIKAITLAGVFIAIITVMTYVPYTGYIKLGPVDITTLHLPVIIGAVILGKEGGLLFGTVWGVLALAKAVSLGDPVFINPLISVIPRMIDGFIIGLVADLFRGKVNFKVYSVICGAVGSVLNTVLVLGAIALFAVDTFVVWFGLDPEHSVTVSETIRNIFLIIISTNGILELGLALFLTPVIVMAIAKVYPVNQKMKFYKN